MCILRFIYHILSVCVPLDINIVLLLFLYTSRYKQQQQQFLFLFLPACLPVFIFPPQFGGQTAGNRGGTHDVHIDFIVSVERI